MPSPSHQAYLHEYLRSDGDDIAWDFIGAAMQSVSKTTIFMMQVGAGGCEGAAMGGWGQKCLWSCRLQLGALHGYLLTCTCMHASPQP